jgi:hypothetical protein
MFVNHPDSGKKQEKEGLHYAKRRKDGILLH